MGHSRLFTLGSGFVYFRPSELVQSSNIDACGFYSGSCWQK